MAIDTRSDPYLAFNFLVEFEGLEVAGFTEVTGLQTETVIETYREGGINTHEHKLAGPTRYPSNLVLKHGLMDVSAMWDWYQDVTQGIIERKNGTIYLLDSQGNSKMWWSIAEAYPVKWIGPEFRADSNTVAFETLEFVHCGITGKITR